jgi:hypothetical protein
MFIGFLYLKSQSESARPAATRAPPRARKAGFISIVEGSPIMLEAMDARKKSPHTIKPTAAPQQTIAFTRSFKPTGGEREAKEKNFAFEALAMRKHPIRSPGGY